MNQEEILDEKLSRLCYWSKAFEVVHRDLKEWPCRPSKYNNMIKEEAVCVLVCMSNSGDYYEIYHMYHDDYRVNELLYLTVTQEDFYEIRKIKKSSEKYNRELQRLILLKRFKKEQKTFKDFNIYVNIG